MAYILIIVLIVSTLIGYKIIGNVPGLLHTPLMSGMNAFSGLTVLSCLIATAAAGAGHLLFARILGYLAIILATINVFSGFFVTERMLRFFRKKNKQENR